MELGGGLGDAPKVLKWSRCFSACATAGLVTTAPRAAPLPIPFAIVTMSGVTCAGALGVGKAPPRAEPMLCQERGATEQRARVLQW